MNITKPISICAANVQRLHNPRKRLTLFTRYARNTRADLFLLSEVGTPTIIEARQWTVECQGLDLDALFFPGCQAAIIWRPSSPFFNNIPPSDINRVSSRVERGLRSVDGIFDICGTNYLVMSVYVPVSPQIRPNFLENLNYHLSPHTQHLETIIGGDWNVVQDPIADSSNPRTVNVGEQQLLDLMASCSLLDSFRILNPTKTLYTNKGTSGADRRLDFILISRSMIGSISSFDTWQPFQSTHSPIILKWIVPGAIPIGPSWFKLGRHIAEDPDLQTHLEWLVSQAHDKAINSFPTSDPCTIWTKTKSFLLPRLQALSQALARLDRLCGLDEPHRLEGLATRARLPAALTGMRSVHMRLRQVREQDLLPAIKNAQGETLTSPDDMLEEAKAFFGKLYTNEPINEAKRLSLLTSLRPKVTAEARRDLERPYKKKDLLHALRKCRDRSSPGPDGLPFSFYKATWSVTGPILKRCINYLASDAAAQPHHITHIVLLHKKGDKDQLGNKRPISLINADDRIMDRAINTRLAPLLPTLIHPSQTGFIPGRWIGTNIETVQNAIDDAGRYPGALAFIDFEKAYDRVDHGYLEATLKAFGFGPRFIHLIMATTRGNHARICLNGWLSSSMPLLRGLRQGSPVAPSLFALCIEPLAARLRSTINGLRHTGLQPFQTDIPHLQSLLFADDAVVGLRDLRDLEKAEAAFELYEAASGGRISKQKSFLYLLGQASTVEWPRWPICQGSFRYLGIQIGRGVQPADIWKSTISKVKARMNAIPMFDLPIATRCSIINIYCFSKVLYLDQFMPAPEGTVQELWDAAIKTIWGTKQHLVNQYLLITPKNHGGFGLLRLDLQFDCGRSKWVAALLSDQWRQQRYLGALRRNISTFIKDNVRMEAITNFNPVFYWERFHPDTIERIYTEFTWVALFGRPYRQAIRGIERWESAISRCERHLPLRWQAYWWSWSWQSRLHGGYANSWAQTFLKPALESFASSPPLEAFYIEGDPQSTSNDVRKARKQIELVESPPIIPSWSLNIIRRRDAWSAWWLALSRVRSRLPEEEQSLHLYALDRLSNPRSWIRPGRPDARWPHNTTRSCILCLQDLDESWNHVFLRCRVARALWQYFSPPQAFPRDPSQLLSIDDPSPLHLAYSACYIHVLYKLLRKRRLSNIQPEPIDHVPLRRQARRLAREANKLERQQEAYD